MSTDLCTVNMNKLTTVFVEWINQRQLTFGCQVHTVAENVQSISVGNF